MSLASGSCLQRRRQVGWRDLQLRILLLAGHDVVDHFIDRQRIVPRAHPRQRLPRLKPATRATADMVTAKKRPLRAGIKLEQFAHGDLRIERGGRGHVGNLAVSGAADKRALYPTRRD